MPELIELMAKAKNSGSETGRNFVKDQDGNVVAVFCYYHKRWELVEHVPYGSKASNQATGLNTMCKQGVSNWTKQNRRYQDAKNKLLDQVLAGELDREAMAQEMEVLNAEYKAIVPINEDLAQYCADNLAELGL